MARPKKQKRINYWQTLLIHVHNFIQSTGKIKQSTPLYTRLILTQCEQLLELDSFDVSPPYASTIKTYIDGLQQHESFLKSLETDELANAYYQWLCKYHEYANRYAKNTFEDVQQQLKLARYENHTVYIKYEGKQDKLSINRVGFDNETMFNYED